MKQLVKIESGHIKLLREGDRLYSLKDRKYEIIESINKNNIILDSDSIIVSSEINSYLLEVETEDIIRYFVSYVGYKNGVKSSFGHFSIKSDNDNYEDFSKNQIDYIKNNIGPDADNIHIVALNRI